MINIPKTNLYIGSILGLQQIDYKNWAYVHATQTIHYKIMGWDRKYNKPDRHHPSYIIYEKENRFSLNWVDGAAHLYEWSGPKTFIKVLDFIDKWIIKRNVLIHCDQGQSRAPTLGLLYLAKRLKTIPNDSFISAKNSFMNTYPNYIPAGIGEYVNSK